MHLAAGGTPAIVKRRVLKSSSKLRTSVYIVRLAVFQLRTANGDKNSVFIPHLTAAHVKLASWPTANKRPWPHFCADGHGFMTHNLTSVVCRPGTRQWDKRGRATARLKASRSIFFGCNQRVCTVSLTI
jgi:hypothetical protein